MPPPGFQLNDLDMGLGLGDHDMMSGYVDTSSDRSNLSVPRMMSNPLAPGDMSLGTSEAFSWEMIGLGLEEPLPPQDMIDELSAAQNLRESPEQSLTARNLDTKSISKEYTLRSR